MKYTVVMGDALVAVKADYMEQDEERVMFWRHTDKEPLPVAEFKRSKVDAMIWEDNNVGQ